MKITFCGAAGTTTGSQHLLEINGQRILLDCGLYQGRREESRLRNSHFLFEPSELEAVVLSHAHIDHSGNLPNLTRQGYRGNIFTTFATRDLCQIMLADSARIQDQDARWLNRQDEKKGRTDHPITPLYTPEDAELCLRQFVTMGYERSMVIAEGVKLTFYDAGHILGSAQVALDLHEHSTGRRKRLLFSGDVGRGHNDLLRDPAVVPDVDYLIMESTYGNREHELETQADDRLSDILQNALRGRGKVIIPSFAVERTQQLIYALHELSEKGELPKVPVYVDSPLAVGATEIFRIHPECFNEEVYRFQFDKKDPFGFEELHLVRKVTDSKKLNELDGPAIIISASGMCEAGRILHHLKNNIEDKRNTVLFVGFCAANTLGARIREGQPVVNILGGSYRVRARVEILDSFSGHADRSELVDYFEHMGGPREKVWLVHGEPEQSAALCENLRGRHDGDVNVAVWKESVEF